MLGPTPGSAPDREPAPAGADERGGPWVTALRTAPPPPSRYAVQVAPLGAGWTVNAGACKPETYGDIANALHAAHELARRAFAAGRLSCVEVQSADGNWALERIYGVPAF
jgi:hypothetical protein